MNQSRLEGIQLTMEATSLESSDAKLMFDLVKNSKPGFLRGVIMIIAKVARYAATEFFNPLEDYKFQLPGKWNLFAWFRIAKFFVVIVIDVVRASKGKEVESDYGFGNNDLKLSKLLKHGEGTE